MLTTCSIFAIISLILVCRRVVATPFDQHSHLAIINDDYCDLVDGSDEPSTAACSHLNVAFSCKSNGNKGVTNVTIPVSRVNDGVCDCCDGSDESSTHHPTCRNVCDAEWAEERKKALSMYRNIQAGLRSKTEITEAFKLSRNQEIKQIDKLKSDYEKIDNMLFRMMLMLKKEEKREKELRFSLIREREARCASGVVPACEYFTPGYFDEDELVYEGYPLEYANPQKRFHYVHSKAELDQLAKLTGLERLRVSICPVKDLLPDDDARIFTQLGEYMTFANSPGGKLSRQTKSPRKRKLNTLFGRFLDNGDKGFLQGQLLLLEWTGLLLSPVTLSMRLVGYAFHRLGQSLWYATQQCAENYVAPSKDSAADDVYHNSGSLLPTSVGHMCKLILDSDVEGSQVANVLAALDYTRYSFIMTTIDIWAEYLATPLWIWEVVYRAPVMYFDYYILQKGDQLPPRRHNCLLRYGIDGARKEMQMLQEQIAAQKELVQQSALRRYMKAVPSDNLFDNEPGRRKRSSKRRVNKDDVLVPLDFGPEGSWESVVNSCLEREEGAHTYSFCFFGEIKQDGVVSLGRFAHWGKTPPFSTPAPSGLSPPAGMISLEMDTTGASYSVLSDDPHSPPPPPSPDSAARVSASKVSESSDTDNTDFQTDLQVPTNPFSWLLEALQPVQDAVFAQTASFWHYLVQENKIAGASPALNKLIASISAFFESPTFTTSATPGTGAVAGGKGGKFGRGGSSTDASRSAAAFATPAHGSTALFPDDPARQQEYYSTQSYLGGTGCYPRQGIPRRTDVLFECGMSTAITEIVETEVCAYKFVISSPLVCTKYLETCALHKLDDLGVFGFSSGKGDARNKGTKGGANNSNAGRNARKN